MINFIKNLFRSKKQEQPHDCDCGHCENNLGTEASVTVIETTVVSPELKRMPKGKRTPGSEPRKSSGKMSAKNTYNESTSPPVGQNTSGDFATSMIVAQATDSAALGMLAGGDPLGAIVGASMTDHSETHHIQHTDYSADSAISTDTTTHYSDHTPSYDNSSYSDSTSFDSSGGDW
jgi:hypothetical protein